VVDAELVDGELAEEAPARRAPKKGTASTQPPKHILADLERLGLW
jgi:hypothetical protein